MKTLEQVLKFETPHVIIACCLMPLNSQSLSDDVDVGKKDVSGVNKFNYKRNIGYLYGLVAGDDSKSIKIECNVCRTSYVLKHSLIVELYKKTVSEEVYDYD